ncbi:hypothetical protein BD769DRAFT_1663127 [Suillus cothurnatus]|nr:hypothetical protein BD769DRAFT_1663127 [Suillus cothurnatus]
MAIFGWLNCNQSEEGCMQQILVQFILWLRTHFEDIKGAISTEAVDSLAPLHWISDLPDFETQFGVQLDEWVTSWTHQVDVQMSSSEAPSSSSSSSSSNPHTPSLLLDPAVVSYETMSSPLLRTIVEDEQAALRDSHDKRERMRKRITTIIIKELLEEAQSITTIAT